jgi:endo-1,4-beta-mannosidase
MRLLEDYWDKEWPTVAADFAEMKRLGANVIRIHLQLARFMDTPDKPNPASLAQLTKLLNLAQTNGLYLDLTGLACYRRADVPNWYTQLDELARWQTQANFWSAIAQTCANHTNIFCYDLINEPSVPAQPRKPHDWLAGDLAGFTYCQVITLDPKGRNRTQLAIDWIQKMSTAIRRHDSKTLITVGLLPFPQGTGFDAVPLANHLDFISVHFYPKSGHLDDQAQQLKKFTTAKPLIVEEIFPLSCSTADLKTFIAQTPFVTGWVGFYWGPPLAELQKSTAPKDRMSAAWLTFFQSQNPYPTNN